jgi:CRISPR system Cascade subunit CasC
VTRTFVDVHVLQTVPPSNINRDDTGSPKSAVYGGVRRARVSSQAWKRATRLLFDDLLDTSELGVRTKRLVELVADEITAQASELSDSAADHAESVIGAAGIKLEKPRQAHRTTKESGYLLLISRRQATRLAGLAVAAARAGTDVEKAAAKSVLQSGNSIDLALFGRMVADVTDLGVDAAAQVAHALSVHAVDTEYDYFTAVDDAKAGSGDEEDAGAGMIGTVEFNSSTLYRYATVDADALGRNLGDPAMTKRGLAAFVRAFVTSMPTGKQNTFANRTLPDAVLVTVRSDQPVSMVAAFEDAIDPAAAGGALRAAVERLAEYAREVDTAYGSAPVQAWVVGTGDRPAQLERVGTRVDLPGLLAGLDATLDERVAGAS